MAGWGSSRSGWGGSRKKSGSTQGFFASLGKLVPDVVENPVKAGVGGAVGLTGNLLGDVKDAAIGIPMGLVMTAKDPIKTAKVLPGAMWSTWSPLFHGDVGKFARQTYDHPLAPILDVASVFTVGAGAAARGASMLEKAGATSSLIRKTAALREHGVAKLADPTGQSAMVLDKQLSTRAGRRLVQNAMLQYDPYLPKFYKRIRYDRAFLREFAGRSLSRQAVEGQALTRAIEIKKLEESGDVAGLQARAGMQIAPPTADTAYASSRLFTEAALQGAEALEDVTELGKRARTAVYANMVVNMFRHNDPVPDATAEELVKRRKGQWGYIMAPEWMDTRYHQGLRTLTKQHARATRRYSSARPKLDAEQAKWERVIAENQELASTDIDALNTELVKQNEKMRRMSDEGWIVSRPALDGKGRPTNRPTPKQMMEATHRPLVQVQERIVALEAKKEAAYRAREVLKVAEDKLQKTKQARENLEAKVVERFNELEAHRDRSVTDYFNHVSDDYDTFVKRVGRFGKDVLTRDPSKALRTEDGRVWVAPVHDAYNLSWEGGNSIRFLHNVLHKPTMIWKSIMLGYTPRTITNNAVGNYFLYAARELPSISGMKAINDAFRYRFGSKMDGEVLFDKNHWLDRWFQDELANQFGIGTEVIQFGDEALTGKASAKRALRQGFYPAVHAIAEKPPRVMTLYKVLRDMPEVKDEIAKLRSKGYRGTDAVDRGIERALSRNPELRDRAALESRRLMGDYVTMSETEKFVRDIIPFYLWSRHILKTTGNMLLDQPVRLNLMSQLSQMGVDETEAMLGEVPEFLKGAIPLAALGLGDRVGRANVLLTASLNPFASVGELAESVNAFVGKGGRKGAAFSQANPFITGTIESVTGVSLLSGKLSKQSDQPVFADLAQQILEGFPQLKLLEAALTPDSEGETLYARDDRSPASSFLGVPIRNVNLERASQLANEGKTKSKRGGWSG